MLTNRKHLPTTTDRLSRPHTDQINLFTYGQSKIQHNCVHLPQAYNVGADKDLKIDGGKHGLPASFASERSETHVCALG